uniref:Pilin n=1 Tax=uncultured Candidatus Melainabacteria bacterium TaxID=2682970 RepID=A0A650ELL3_9BACT|nr:hypothetical protein Melaina855_2410 [uncultured Candidatus Melainabacteria bacterium]
MNNIKKGFTLAEVLVTLSIVGIVAVLTIPSIVKNYRYKTYVTSLKKIYSQVTDAAQAIMNDEMTTDFHKTTAGVPSDGNKGAGYFLRNYFKSSEACTTPSLGSACLGSSYKTFHGTPITSIFGEYCIRTVNGATLCMMLNTDNNDSSIFVDVNGPSDPNIVGLDAFVMTINEYGLVSDWPDGTSETCNNKTKEGEAIEDHAQGCLKQIMDDGWIIDDTKWTK